MIIDASVWVSKFLVEDTHHAATERWLDRLTDDDMLFVPAIALAEVAGAIARRTGESYLARWATDWLLDAPYLRVVGVDAALGIEAARVASIHRLKGADAVYAALAASLDLPLVTWDDEFSSRLTGVIDIRRPAP